MNSWVLANHVRLSGQVLKAIRELYQKIACDKAVINAGILARIIAHLNPFWLNAADDKELWIVAHAVFINILITGLPVVRQFSDLADFDALWAPLAQALRDFLFNVSLFFEKLCSLFNLGPIRSTINRAAY